MFTVNRNKMARAGKGDKIHVAYTGINISGIEFAGLECGADFSNGSGYGRINRLYDLDLNKITCKKCLKRLEKINNIK